MVAPKQDSPATTHLFSPLGLRGVTARNRIMAAPMCQYLSDEGKPTDWHLAHLGRLAIGGCGIVFAEETAVEARGRKTYHCAGLWQDDQIESHRRVASFLREQGALAGLQLGHAGAKASCHGALKDWAPLRPEDAASGYAPWEPLGPSEIALTPGKPLSRAMTQGDINEVIEAFVQAARRADEAGFDLLEIHGAHGYLIHEFLSPLTNRRSDRYGGDLAGRMRFLLEISEAVRSAWPNEKPLFVRVSCVDGQGGAWRLGDSIALAKALAALEVDMIDCSSGGITGDSDLPVVPRVPGYQVPFAETIRQEAGIPTVAVGLITDPFQAEIILAKGQADVIAMARTLMEEADWPLRAAKTLGEPDPYGLQPEGYSQRLRLRDKVAELPINQGAAASAAQVKLLETT